MGRLKRWVELLRELACRPLPWWGALLVIVGAVTLIVVTDPWGIALCCLYVLVSGSSRAGKKGSTPS